LVAVTGHKLTPCSHKKEHCPVGVLNGVLR
jgi:hypothetical protein